MFCIEVADAGLCFIWRASIHLSKKTAVIQGTNTVLSCFKSKVPIILALPFILLKILLKTYKWICTTCLNTLKNKNERSI
jgi:hypothetical protein